MKESGCDMFRVAAQINQLGGLSRPTYLFSGIFL